jgi:hypothetical protein
MEPEPGSSPYAGLLTTARYPCQAARANRKALARNGKRGERLTDANRHLIVSGPMLMRLPAESRFNTESDLWGARIA